MTATMTSRLVDGLAKALPSKVNRRSFLTRTAVVGSALAADPLEYVLKPNTAYAAVCNCKGSACECGSMCCDGYTEFCCTITGQNKCPANTYLAGWWKADTSPGFCGGPRYYMDCNAPCNGCGCGSNGVCSGGCSGTGCGCAGGNCNNRAAGCTHFRYGQCNNQIACLGPIVCRIVTCVPPWALEPSCTSVVRVDENTAWHDKACLHAVTGTIDALSAGGNNTFVAGWALDFDTQAPVTIQATVNGQVAATTTANVFRPDVGGAYQGYGNNHGYELNVPHPGMAHTLCVAALNAGYGSEPALLGCRQIPQRTTGSPFGAIDVAAGQRGGIRVAGWVVDPDRPDSTAVHVYVDGQFAGDAIANLPRPDVGAVLPGKGSAHGYDLTVPAGPGNHTVCVYGINLGPSSPNSQIGCKAVTVPSGMPIGRVEVIQTGASQVRVAGWTLDPDTANPLTLHVYSDDTLIGTAVANLDRPDVGNFFKGYGNAHGFDARLAMPGGVHLLRVFALNQGPADPPTALVAQNVNVPTGPPFGHVDLVERGPGVIRVAGWAADPDTTAPVDIHIYADGNLVGTTRANQNRPDVGAAFPLYGAAHGFNTVVPFPRGTHLLRVFVINAGPPAGNPAIYAAPVTLP